MLELPESYTISKQIHESLSGKIISYIEVLHTPHKFAFFKGEIRRLSGGAEDCRCNQSWRDDSSADRGLCHCVCRWSVSEIL